MMPLSRRRLKFAPGADGLFFSPHLGGRICPADPARRGSWTGFSWGHTRAHFFRSILESVGFEYSYLSLGARKPRTGSRARRGARRWRWREKRRLEPDQGGHFRRALSASGARRHRHVGERHRGGSRRRTDPRYGRRGSARVGARLSPDHAGVGRAGRISQNRQGLHRMAEGNGSEMNGRPEPHTHMPDRRGPRRPRSRQLYRAAHRRSRARGRSRRSPRDRRKRSQRTSASRRALPM